MEDDPFDQLGLPPTFDVDELSLQRAYLARAAAHHPDLAPDAGHESIARLNHARATLADPERRAAALLTRLGGPSKEQDRTLPPDFLASMMETQEAVQADRDAGEPLDPWRAWVEDRRRETIEEVGALFRTLGSPPAPAALRVIRARLNMWRYLERIAEQLDA